MNLKEIQLKRQQHQQHSGIAAYYYPSINSKSESLHSAAQTCNTEADVELLLMTENNAVKEKFMKYNLIEQLNGLVNFLFDKNLENFDLYILQYFNAHSDCS